MVRPALRPAAIAVAVCGVSLLLTCTSVDDGALDRSNPYDPGGSAWAISLPPVIDSVSVDDEPLWSNYGTTGGSVLMDIVAHDPNEDYDTLTCMVRLGTSADTLRTVMTGTPGLLEVSGLAPATRYYWQVVVMDRFDSTWTVAGTFLTPNGTPPNAPSGFSATSSASRITVGWTSATSGTCEYRLRRGGPSDDAFPLRLTSANPGLGVRSTLYDTVPDFLPYRYTLSVANQFGERRCADTLWARRYTDAISAPGSVSAMYEGCSRVRVTWYTYSTYRYQVYRRAEGESTFRLVAVTSSGQPLHIDTLPDPGKDYYYAVASVAASGIGSGLSVPVVASSGVGAPTGFAATSGLPVAIRLTWSPKAGAARYVIMRGGSYDSINTDVPLDTTAAIAYYDTVPSTGYYYYRVAAIDTCGHRGPHSTPASGYRSGLSAPSSASASLGSYDAFVRVMWSSVSGAAGYYIYRKTTSLGLDTCAPFDSVGGLVYDDSVPDGRTYYYRIAAYAVHGQAGTRTYALQGRRNGPTQPGNLYASDGAYRDSVVVSWSPVSGATRYIVLRADSVYVYDSARVLDTVDATRYADMAPRYDIDYYYWVKGLGATGLDGVPAGPESGYLSRPNTPDGITVSQGNAGYVLVSWYGQFGAASYRVYRSDDNRVSSFLVGTIAGTSFRDTTTIAGTYYYYRVAAVDSAGRASKVSYWSSGFSSGFGAPTQVIASAGRYTDSIVVSWDNVPQSARYHVYRSTVGTYVHVATTTMTSYADTSCQPGTTYYYKIAAWNAQSGESAQSANVYGWLANGVPAVPTLTTESGYDSVLLRATASATGSVPEYFRLYRSSTSTGVNALVDSSATGAFIDSLIDTLPRYYKVTAVNSFGASPITTYKSASLLRLAAPQGLQASDSAFYGRVALSWRPVAGAAGYTILRVTYTALAPIGTTTDTVWSDTAPAATSTSYRVRAFTARANPGLASAQEFGSARLFLPPDSLTATDRVHMDRIVLRWAAVAEAQSYLVQRRVDVGSFVQIAVVTATTYIDVDVDSSHSYTYRVLSFSDTLGTSRSGAEVNAQVLHSAPVAPPAPAIAPSVTELRISWQEVTLPLATGYVVHRAGVVGGPYTRVDTVTTGLTYVDTVPDTTVYFYKVSAMNSLGESPLSPPSVATQLDRPAAPAMVGATQGQYTGRIVVVWRHSYEKAYPYVVSRRTAQGTASVPIDTVSDSMFVDTAVDTGWNVYAVAVLGRRMGWSSATAAGTILVPPRRPAAAGSPTGIAVAWNAVTGATKYIVHRASQAAGPYQDVDSLTATTWFDSVSSADTFYYRVSASSFNRTVPSESCWASLTVPGPIASVDATRGILADSIALSWSPVVGAQAYVVLRGPTAASLAPIDTVNATRYGERVLSDSVQTYAVRALNAAGVWASGGTAEGYRRPRSVPMAPGAPGASTGLRASVQVTWQAADRATSVEGYRVLRATSRDGAYAVIASVSSTATQFYDVPPQMSPVTFWYKVRAYNLAGEGVESAGVEGMALE